MTQDLPSISPRASLGRGVGRLQENANACGLALLGAPVERLPVRRFGSAPRRETTLPRRHGLFAGIALARWGRTALITGAVAVLPGCAINDAFDQSVLRVDRSLETIRNSLVLTNIVRASFNAPLTFISVPTIHGSSMVGGTAGVPTFTFGPGRTVQQGQYGFGPNSLTASGTTSFDVATLDSKDFDRGLLTTLSLNTLGFFLQQGFPRDILFYLTIDRIVVGRGAARRELKNDSRYPSFREFSSKVQSALELGLTVENAGEDKKAVRFCFDPSLASRAIDGARPICGAGGKDGLSLDRESGSGTPAEIEVDLRSTQGIFYALGHIITAPPEEQVVVPDLRHRSAGEALFEVKTGVSASPCLARAEYNGTIYCVPLGKARNSALAIGLLAQLLALNTSVNDLPLTSTVRITP